MFAEPLPSLSASDRAALLALARRAIADHLDHRPPTSTDDLPRRLRTAQDAFVSLHIGGQLRGCIGMVEAERPLCEVVTRCAVGAAVEDPRFPPLTIAEMDRLQGIRHVVRAR